MKTSLVPPLVGRRGVAVPFAALIAALVASAAFSSIPVRAAAPPAVRHVATPAAASRAALPPTNLGQAPASLRAAVRAAMPEPSLSTGPLQKAYFGLSVALSGSTALVGAIRGAGGDGAVYEFLQSGPSWSQEAELTAADATAGAALGDAVAISGSTAVVGADNKNSSTGAAYIYVLP